MHRSFFLALLLLPACTASVGNPGGAHACPAIVVPAVVVTAVDAASSEQLCNATVIARVGSQTFSLAVFDHPAAGACNYQTLGDPPGSYTISVTAPGYLPQQVTAVEVFADDCGVAATQSVEVQLMRAN